LIQLKVETHTPLSAAVQVLFYGLANVFFQLNRDRVCPKETGSVLLDVKKIHLRVIAPVAYYERFESATSRLRQFESHLNDGLIHFSEALNQQECPRIFDFRFDAFPSWFVWDPSRQSDASHREELLAAMDQRRAFFE
jgi:hypothetical protein